MLREKQKIIDDLENAFNIRHADKVKRTLSTEDRMLCILLEMAAVVNKLIEKNNNLAKQVVGPQKPKPDHNGIILL